MKARTSHLSLLGVVAIACCYLGCGRSTSDEGAGGRGGSSSGDPAVVGTWTGLELDGSSVPWTFILTATTLDVRSSGIESYKGTYTVDTSVEPKRVAAIITECPMAPSFVGKPSNAIYKIEGATMTFAGNMPGVIAFPTSFAPDSAGQTRVFKLTKQ